jgi:hypothetical protein
MAKEQILIPKDVALQICSEIQAAYKDKWWTFAGMQCIGCRAASKADPEKMCVYNAPGYRGCNLVNARYEHKSGKT